MCFTSDRCLGKAVPMTSTIQMPLWVFLLILCFAAVTALSHFLLPSVRWFFRRRLERAVARLNTRLTRPIEPFKLARRHDMIQRLVYDPDVTKAIVEHAKTEGLREDVAFQMAQRYAREIVPSFSAFAYFGFGIRASRWFANALYDVRTGSRNDDILRDIPAEATIVFVMNHRSNMDYVLVTFLSARASALSYAVGEWARVWPLSRLIKSMGAYFIRRKSRGLLYRKVLARYVYMATEGGVTQAIFPEGGLSLDGALAPPKLGLLSYVIEAGRSAEAPVYFVPVAINYDRVLEDRVLTAAGERGDRRFNAKISVMAGFVVHNLVRRIRGRFNKFGQAAVVFGVPKALSDYSHDLELEAIGQDLMDRISVDMPVLPVARMAHVLLEARSALPDDEFRKAFDRTRAAHAPLEPDMESGAAFDHALQHLVQRHLVTQTDNGWQVADGEQALLSYYARSIAKSAEDCSAIAK